MQGEMETGNTSHAHLNSGGVVEGGGVPAGTMHEGNGHGGDTGGQGQPPDQATQVPPNANLEDQISRVHTGIEMCMRQALSVEEAAIVLYCDDRFNVHPDVTIAVWRELEKANEPYFRAYNLHLRLKSCVERFNRAVLTQARIVHVRKASALPRQQLLLRGIAHAARAGGEDSRLNAALCLAFAGRDVGLAPSRQHQLKREKDKGKEKDANAGIKKETLRAEETQGGHTDAAVGAEKEKRETGDAAADPAELTETFGEWDRRVRAMLEASGALPPPSPPGRGPRPGMTGGGKSALYASAASSSNSLPPPFHPPPHAPRPPFHGSRPSPFPPPSAVPGGPSSLPPSGLVRCSSSLGSVAVSEKRGGGAGGTGTRRNLSLSGASSSPAVSQVQVGGGGGPGTGTIPSALFPQNAPPSSHSLFVPSASQGSSVSGSRTQQTMPPHLATAAGGAVAPPAGLSAGGAAEEVSSSSSSSASGYAPWMKPGGTGTVAALPPVHIGRVSPPALTGAQTQQFSGSTPPDVPPPSHDASRDEQNGQPAAKKPKIIKEEHV
uniref:Uncharacterized protein n=1 Tax=Chromera velia CCMP2878 TaxID=1169474 RepID=A0A0G4HUD0_9ALVE|eukprot:Cvel_8627.t1-p1 / transcript=Cvel_8627.t1 / gene=Cvel_8627 / organism=Chromera_velia_CCMP2878 / gene_product=hypothetical protein / transcript_product=hypothetical protein / location=Cvel_scaffold480:51798-55581(+) / protein_length=549 / sequence_SO=supercontig / SO=protein_coding / is_pseudo=false